LLSNQTHQSDTENETLETLETVIEVSAFDLLKHPRFIFPCLSASLLYFLLSYLEPILGFRCLDFGLNQTQIGMMFVIMPLSYIPSSI
jgi:hypothetical protein